MTKNQATDRIALIDLDGTVANYDAAMKEAMKTLQAPGESPHEDRYTGGKEPPYIEARRKLIQRQPGFWRGLKAIPLAWAVIEELREVGFALHVLTKGPMKNGPAWGEKVDWCAEHLPDALVTVTTDKSLVYGRILFDDFPPYFESWLSARPRGLVICLAHPWNADYAPDGPKARKNVIRYDGKNFEDVRKAIHQASVRESGQDMEDIKKGPFRVTINGVGRTIENIALTYTDIVELAGHDSSRVLTVVWGRGDPSQREGILIRGQSVKVRDGMYFSVADTSNA